MSTSIEQLTGMVARTLGFGGVIERDAGERNGTPHKVMSSARLAAVGWLAKTPRQENLASTYGRHTGKRRRIGVIA